MAMRQDHDAHYVFFQYEYIRHVAFGALKSYPRTSPIDEREGRSAIKRHREYSAGTLTLCRCESEPGLRVVVTNVANQACERVLVERVFAVLHPAAEPGA